MHSEVGTGTGAGERWLILLVLFLARTTIAFQLQSVAALSAFLISALGIDYTQLGFLIGVYLLPGIVIAYPGGLLGQRFGDKWIALLGLALMAVGGLVTAVGSDYASLLAGRLISGIGAVLLNVLLTKMTTDWFAGREIGTAMGLLLSSWPIGIAIALVALPWLAVRASTAAALGTSGAAAALVLVLLALIYRAPDGAVAPAAAQPEARARLSWRELGLVSLAGHIWMLFNVGYIVVVSFGPAFLTTRGFSPGAAGSMISLISWTVTLTIPFGGVLLDRVGHATLLMIASFTAFGLCTFLMPAAPWPALMVPIGLAAGLPAGAMMVLPGEVLARQNRAAGTGVFFTWYYVGMALLTPVAGILRDATGAPDAPLLFAAAMEFAAVFALIALRWAQRRGDAAL